MPGAQPAPPALPWLRSDTHPETLPALSPSPPATPEPGPGSALHTPDTGAWPAGAGCTQQPEAPYWPHETAAWDAIRSLPNMQRTRSTTPPRHGLAAIAPGATGLAKSELLCLGPCSCHGRDGQERAHSRPSTVLAPAPGADPAGAAPQQVPAAWAPQPTPRSAGPTRDGAAASKLRAPSTLHGQCSPHPDTQPGTTGAPRAGPAGTALRSRGLQTPSEHRPPVTTT